MPQTVSFFTVPFLASSLCFLRTGLRGYPVDRVLEIGIAEYDEVSGKISPVYSEMIRYDDIVDFDSKYVNIDGSRGIWIYRNSDMRMEDTLNAAKDLDTVVREVREIVSGKGHVLQCEIRFREVPVSGAVEHP